MNYEAISRLYNTTALALLLACGSETRRCFQYMPEADADDTGHKGLLKVSMSVVRRAHELNFGL